MIKPSAPKMQWPWRRFYLTGFYNVVSGFRFFKAKHSTSIQTVIRKSSRKKETLEMQNIQMRSFLRLYSHRPKGSIQALYTPVMANEKIAYQASLWKAAN